MTQLPPTLVSGGEGRGRFTVVSIDPDTIVDPATPLFTEAVLAAVAPTLDTGQPPRTSGAGSDCPGCAAVASRPHQQTALCRPRGICQPGFPNRNRSEGDSHDDDTAELATPRVAPYG